MAKECQKNLSGAQGTARPTTMSPHQLIEYVGDTFFGHLLHRYKCAAELLELKGIIVPK